MAQPKNPPVSLRISPPLLAEVDAVAKKRGTTRNALILQCIVDGISGDAPRNVVTAPEKVRSPLPISSRSERGTLAKIAKARMTIDDARPPEPPGSRLKKR